MLNISKELSNTLCAAVNYFLYFLFYYDQKSSDSCVRLSLAELPISSLKQEASSRQIRQPPKLLNVHPPLEKNGMNAWEKATCLNLNTKLAEHFFTLLPCAQL